MIYEKQKRYIIPFTDVPSARAGMPEISVDERRGNFTEVETGFPEAVAVQEAKRCLSCRRCLGCGLCLAEDNEDSIDFNIPGEELTLEFDEVIITKGQDNAFHPIKPELGFDTYADVITDLQFERMLSPNGPTGGLVVSPLDAEIPCRIAIVQGSSNEEDEKHLFSSLVLGVNESILALDKTQDLEVALISPVCQSFKEKFSSDAEQISGLGIIEGIPESVERKGEEGPLSLTYSTGGQSKTEDFDLLVVLTKEKISPEIMELSRKLDQEIQ